MVHIIGGGGPTDRSSLHIETREGRRIPNERRPEMLPDRMASAAKQYRQTHGVELLSASAVYNCAGLVFGSRRTWIDVDDIDIPIKDDGFEDVSDPREWNVGDVVVYRGARGELTHVGVIHFVDLGIANEVVMRVISVGRRR